MIIRAHRFHGYNALRHAYGRGQTMRGQLLAIKYLPNPKRSSYRAAVVVSRKVHKSAVVRGRIRRRLYEIIRLHEAEIVQPYDIIITAFSEQLATIPADQLQDMTLQLLKRSVMDKSVETASTSLAERQTHGIVESKERD